MALNSALIEGYVKSIGVVETDLSTGEKYATLYFHPEKESSELYQMDLYRALIKGEYLERFIQIRETNTIETVRFVGKMRADGLIMAEHVEIRKRKESVNEQ